MAKKSLNDMIASGHIAIEYQENEDSIRLTRKQYSRETGEEVQSQHETFDRTYLNYLIEMREEQLADLNEMLKYFPEK